MAGCSKRWMEARNSADQGDLLEIVERLLEHLFVGIAGGHANPNASNRHLNLGADLQQLQPNRRALRALHLRAFQAEPPQVVHQDVGY